MKSLAKPCSLMLLFAVVLTMANGCIRLAEESHLLKYRDRPAELSPPERFYTGTRLALHLALFFMDESSHESLPARCIIIPPTLVGACIAVPLEAVCDTLLLPYDIYRTVQYQIDQPLETLIEQNDIGGLMRSLAQGKDPNTIDIRHGNPMLPIMKAVKCHNAEAFAILLEYDAQVPLAAICSYTTLDKDIIPLALEKGITPGIGPEVHWLPNVDFPDKCLITKWLTHSRYTASRDFLPALDDLLNIVTCLLEHGYSPNGAIPRNVEANLCDKTPLDIILENTELESELKQRFIDVLKKHGAMTYQQLKQQP